MSTKDWLRRARLIRLRLKALEESKQRAYIRATSSTVGMGERVSGGVPADTHAAYANLSREVDRQMDKLERTRAEILQALGQLEDNILATLLTEYYVNDKTWKEVAEAMGYSWRQVMRLHRQAIQDMREILGMEQ